MEDEIRRVIREEMVWAEESAERGVVKIWYLRPEEEGEEAERLLRLAITVTGILPLSTEGERRIITRLLDAVLEHINRNNDKSET